MNNTLADVNKRCTNCNKLSIKYLTKVIFRTKFNKYYHINVYLNRLFIKGKIFS